MLRLQRGKFNMKLIEESPRSHKDIEVVIIILRLAISLQRSRDWDASRRVKIKLKNKTFKVKFPKGYLDNHPLTEADLTHEKHEIARAGYKLKFS